MTKRSLLKTYERALRRITKAHQCHCVYNGPWKHVGICPFGIAERALARGKKLKDSISNLAIPTLSAAKAKKERLNFHKAIKSLPAASERRLKELIRASGTEDYEWEAF